MAKPEFNRVTSSSKTNSHADSRTKNKLTILWKRDNELNLLVGPTKRCNCPKTKPELLRLFHAKLFHTSRSIIHKQTQIILTTNNITHSNLYYQKSYHIAYRNQRFLRAISVYIDPPKIVLNIGVLI
jgi:hypothetical protein